MATLSQIRTDLGTRLAAINGLNIYPVIPDLIEEPAGVVGMPAEINYDLTMGSVVSVWMIPVRLYVCRYDAEDAQEMLDQYLEASGALSVKAAVENTAVAITSGWHVARVSTVRDFGAYRVGNIDYLGCELTVEVVA